ncbi:hypothetical protein QQ056_14855 [Oscillatoria laete-virens NRMC-F 0139]|nr:hypothetical protein [Oscillatoria laete-virens]MDL5054817.1 hypothetical protein [Oscillatoria laete-virens NRMC-F 0139]
MADVSGNSGMVREVGTMSLAAFYALSTKPMNAIESVMATYESNVNELKRLQKQIDQQKQSIDVVNEEIGGYLDEFRDIYNEQYRELFGLLGSSRGDLNRSQSEQDALFQQALAKAKILESKVGSVGVNWPQPQQREIIVRDRKGNIVDRYWEGYFEWVEMKLSWDEMNGHRYTKRVPETKVAVLKGRNGNYQDTRETLARRLNMALAELHKSYHQAGPRAEYARAQEKKKGLEEQVKALKVAQQAIEQTVEYRNQTTIVGFTGRHLTSLGSFNDLMRARQTPTEPMLLAQAPGQTASDAGGGGKKPLPQDDSEYPVQSTWGKKPSINQSGDYGAFTVNADGTYSQSTVHWTGNGDERYYTKDTSTGGIYLHYDQDGKLVKQINWNNDKPVVLPTPQVVKLQKQTQHVINQARVDANSGLGQGMINLFQNHRGGGHMDFKQVSRDRRFVVDGKVYRADEFGNYIAGYSGHQWIPIVGPMIVKAAGIYYDLDPDVRELDRDQRSGFSEDFDADSRPDINAGIKKSKEENKEK